MFLNIFSVTLSEDFIAYILLHFTYPLRQVSSTKPCILACRIRVLSAIRKEFLRCRFFFPPPLQAEKNGRKADAFGHFRAHENGKRTFFRQSCEPRGKNCRTTATKFSRWHPKRYNGNRFSISKSSPRFFAFPNFCIHSRHSVYATRSPYWNCVSSSSLNSNNSSI